jgi:hypothetical protein
MIHFFDAHTFFAKITVLAKIYEYDHSLKFLQKSQIFYQQFSWTNFYMTCDFSRFSRKYYPDCCEKKKFHKNICFICSNEVFRENMCKTILIANACSSLKN